LHGHLGPEN